MSTHLSEDCAGSQLQATVVACPQCQGLLDLLQPWQSDPDRLLAACPDCRALYHALFCGGSLILSPIVAAGQAVGR